MKMSIYQTEVAAVILGAFNYERHWALRTSENVFRGGKIKQTIIMVCFFGIPGGNRTHNYALGEHCYIHLTTETY